MARGKTKKTGAQRSVQRQPNRQQQHQLPLPEHYDFPPFDQLRFDRVVSTHHPEGAGEEKGRTKDEPELCLVMIQRNEGEDILDGLESLVDASCGRLRRWLILDTGSTDDSPEKITRFFSDKNISGCLVYAPWNFQEHSQFHFGWNRTLALRLATSTLFPPLPPGSVLWMHDADDRILVEEGKREELVRFWQSVLDPRLIGEEDGWKPTIRLGSHDFPRVQLMRERPGHLWYYHEETHEFPCLDAEMDLRTGNPIDQPRRERWSPVRPPFVICAGTHGHRSKTQKSWEKYRKDALRFDEKLKQYPDHFRWIQYGAQSWGDYVNEYMDSPDYDSKVQLCRDLALQGALRSIQLNRDCAKRSVYDADIRYMALYRVAKMMRRFPQQFTQDEWLRVLREAWEQSPKRVEAAFDLMQSLYEANPKSSDAWSIARKILRPSDVDSDGLDRALEKDSAKEDELWDGLTDPGIPTDRSWFLCDLPKYQWYFTFRAGQIAYESGHFRDYFQWSRRCLRSPHTPDRYREWARLNVANARMWIAKQK